MHPCPSLATPLAIDIIASELHHVHSHFMGNGNSHSRYRALIPRGRIRRVTVRCRLVPVDTIRLASRPVEVARRRSVAWIITDGLRGGRGAGAWSQADRRGTDPPTDRLAPRRPARPDRQTERPRVDGAPRGGTARTRTDAVLSYAATKPGSADDLINDERRQHGEHTPFGIFSAFLVFSVDDTFA